MKLLTLNCHSLEEPGYEEKLSLFCMAVSREQPDVIALQEVNQTRAAKAADPARVSRFGYVPSTGGMAAIPIRSDNHALRVSELDGRAHV